MFGKKIKDLRDSKNMTQQELADDLGISQRTVASWETGGKMPSNKLIKKIADYFYVSTDFLFDRTDDPFFVKKSRNGIIVLSAKKEPPALTDGEPATRVDLSVSSDDLPKDRKELEEFVLDLLHKSQEDR